MRSSVALSIFIVVKQVSRILKFWYVTFLLPFSSLYFLISIKISSLTHESFRRVYKFPYIWNFKVTLVIDFRLSELSFLNFCFPHLFASCTLALLSYKISVPKLEDTMLLTFVGCFWSVNNDTNWKKLKNKK